MGLGLGPTSCREAKGLGSRRRAWENRPSKRSRQFPLAMEKRGLQGHSGRTAKYRDARRWKWFLPAAGGPAVPSHRSRDEAGRSSVCENELGVTGQPVANSGA